MLKKVGHFGHSYVLPSFENIRTKGAERRKDIMEEKAKPIRESWTITVYTLVSEGFTN
jgi:hypothetical protein